VSESVSLVFKNIFYMPLTPKGIKKLVCNSLHLILCEKNGLVRVFNKETGRFVQNLRTTSANYVKDICVDMSNDDIYIAFNYSIEVFDSKYKLKWTYEFASSGSSISNGLKDQRLLSPSSSRASLKSNSVHNLPINIFNATTSSSRKSEKDEDEDEKRIILGKITHVCVGKNGTIAVVTQDEQNKYNSRFYVFTDF
jgi:hypothetical protein